MAVPPTHTGGQYELVWYRSFAHPIHRLWYGDLTHDGLNELVILSTGGVHVLQVITCPRETMAPCSCAHRLPAPSAARIPLKPLNGAGRSGSIHLGEFKLVFCPLMNICHLCRYDVSLCPPSTTWCRPVMCV